jgi:hypothetical protein
MGSEMGQPRSTSSDYNPIESVTLPKIGAFKPRGLIVVVGPNSCGKTQFLRDVDHAINGEPRNLVVCKAVTRSLPVDIDEFMEHLIEQGYCRRIKDEMNDGLQHITPQFGIGPGHGSVMRPEAIRQLYEQAKPLLTSTSEMPEIIFFRLFRHCLSTALYLERRLSLTEPAKHYDSDSALILNDLQALFLDRAAQQTLSREVQCAFSLGIWLDSTGKKLCLRVDQTGAVPSADERLNPSAMATYRQISTQGDGVKSYVGMCSALLLGRCPILLIDEPELGLHPPQAHAIGRFLGGFAESKHHTIFVATHSSHVLRGVIETAPQAQILRLCRREEHFGAHFVGKDTVKSCLDAPTARAETVLDGLFSECVAVVESEGDRLVYEAAWTHVARDFRREIRFVPVGGTGGIAQAVRFYRALKIPTAVIADLDLLLDRTRFQDTLLALFDEDGATPIVERADIAREEVRRIVPGISEREVKERLAELMSTPLDWQKGDDKSLCREIRRLSKEVDRVRRLKDGGVDRYAEHPGISRQLQTLIDESAKAGLFLVPVGELENWASELMSDGPSKSKKAEWASEAVRRIRHSPDNAANIIQFVRRVGEFQCAEAERLAAD